MIAETSILSNLISKIISDCVDVSKEKIRKADKDRKFLNQNLQTRIYQVIIDSLNKYTHNRFNQKDMLYNAAENMLKELKKNEIDSTQAIRFGLLILDPYINDNKCKIFLEILHQEICKDENYDLFKEVNIIQQEKIINDLNVIVKNNFLADKNITRKLDTIDNNVNYIKENLYEKKEGVFTAFKTQVKNRINDYEKKWTENMFLNNYNKRDEQSGENIELYKVYLEEHLPYYIWKSNNNLSKDLKELLKEYVAQFSEKKMLLILGQPGIGKSTLITWIVANFKKSRDHILVYQFASDLKNINWQCKNIFSEILKELNLEYVALESKILILDGFDEMRANSNRENILNQIYQELKKLDLLQKFSLIITCRENFVYQLQKLECDYVTLQPWDSNQILSFCSIYGKYNKSKISNITRRKILENKEILGTPLILYMVLALNITIEENGSIVDVYEQIFSLDAGSIYDRCIKNFRFAEPHRISEVKIKQQIHQISQKIAFWIFENNSEEAFIPWIEYEKICDIIIRETEEMNEELKRDFLIGNYFKLIKHWEGLKKEELHFVHRSIYEYFVAEYFFEALHHLTSSEIIMEQLSVLLKDGHLSEQILDFIKYKFDKLYMNNISRTVKDIFQSMLQTSMTYYAKEKYTNIIAKEINIFANMLELVRLWNQTLGEFDEKIISYLRYNNHRNLNLRGIKLKSANLDRAFLEGANLDDADLISAHLKMANLSAAHLRNTHLDDAILDYSYMNRADLIGAYLSNAHLCEVKLEKADLSGVNLIGAELIKANLRGAEFVGTRLINAKLQGANLSNTKFVNADLSGAKMMGAEISGIEISGLIYLRGTIFDENQVHLLSSKYDLSNSKVYISETEEIITYNEYCNRLTLPETDL